MQVPTLPMSLCSCHAMRMLFVYILCEPCRRIFLVMLDQLSCLDAPPYQMHVALVPSAFGVMLTPVQKQFVDQCMLQCASA